MIHQPSMQGLAGQAADIDIYAKEILRMREILNNILAVASGQTAERGGARRGSRLHHESGAGDGIRTDRSRHIEPRSGSGAGIEARVIPDAKVGFAVEPACKARSTLSV